MQTKPFDTPVRGMLLFNEDVHLVVSVTKVNGRDFDFHVHNGYWEGTWADGSILVHETGQVIQDKEGFEEIVSLTPEDIGDWYLDDCHLARQILKEHPFNPVEEPDDDPDDEVPF